MSKVQRKLVWLSRLGHCRGFGIQSPWAYSLDRYVINEHFPYYAYDELASAYPDVDGETRRLCELYFRLANYRQPHKICLFLPHADVYAAYLKRGCMTVDVILAKQSLEGIQTVELALMSLSDSLAESCYESILQKVDEHSVLAVEGIAANRQSKQMWRDIVDDDRTGVSFDLYDCGLVFFDKQRYKKNYIINF